MPSIHYAGTTVFYRQQGSPQAPIVLILPGNTASTVFHSGELDFFQSLGYQAIAVDMLGTGQSGRLPRPWPADWFQRNAAACAALLDSLGAQRTILCGTSGGAIVALWMAILYPERVTAVIADSEAIRFTPENFRALVADRAQRHPAQIGFWTDAQGEDWQAVVEADTELFLTIEKEKSRQGMWEIHEGRLSEIRCPALFTCSLNDDLVPGVGPQMLEMASQVAGSQFFANQQGSHPLMWSAPKAFQAAARAFLTCANLLP